MSECICIKKLKDYPQIEIDQKYYFSIYGTLMNICSEKEYVANITINDFKKHFSYLKDSKNRIAL